MSEGKRKVFIIIVLLLVILFGVGQFFSYSNLNTASQQAQNGSSGTGSNTPATQVISYAPPTPASSTPVESGSCFASSVAAPYRADAYRCSVGNAINDPCFAFTDANQIAPGTTAKIPELFCGANPAYGAAVSSTFVLRLTKSLPAPQVPSSTPSNWAWLVELGDGTICTPFTGTRPFSATGEVATYACNGVAAGKANEQMIFGDLNNAAATWTAEVGTLSTATSTFPPPLVASATVPVYAVWE